mgnify:CR=1 FL=1
MRNPIGAVVVLIIIIAGGWYLFSGNSAEAPALETAVTNQMPVVDSTTPETVVENTTPNVTITYTDQGFSPASVTAPLGTTVNFVNQSSKNMWVAAAMHPAHTVYSGTALAEHCPDTTGTAFDECKGDAPGTSYSFKFNKEGTGKYHDHIDATKCGSVIVTPATSL